MPGDQESAGGQGESLFDRRTFLGIAGGSAASLGFGLASGRASASADDPQVDVTSITADHDWETVRLSNTYADPVVIAPSLSHNGTQPATTRVRNVGGDAFELAVEEWIYLDGRHREETIGALTTTPGSYRLADGTTVEVGRVQTDHRWATDSLSGSFSTTPVVFSGSQTRNGGQPIVTRHRGVSAESVDVRLQEEEAQGPHRVEDIGYLAVDRGTGTWRGHAFEAGVRSDVDQTWETVDFDGSYEQPVFIADLQTFRGWNSCGVRYRNLTQSSVDLKLQEERSRDAESDHVGERVGYLVVEGAAEDTTSGDAGDGSEELDRRSRIERRIHEYVNERRGNHGLAALDFDTDLREIARYHSRDMAQNDYFAHTSPSGETMSDRYERFGYDCSEETSGGGYITGGENIAYLYAGQNDTAADLAQEIVQMWMNSSGHRENILTETWNQEGIGVYIASDGQVYATQNFC